LYVPIQCPREFSLVGLNNAYMQSLKFKRRSLQKEMFQSNMGYYQ